jgi:hypothetical protein
MNDAVYHEIHDCLLAATRTDRIRWRKLAESVFETPFADALVTIERNHRYPRSPAVLRIHNAERVQVAYLADEPLNEEEVVAFCLFDPSELFDEVERRVYRREDTLLALLEELRRTTASQD